MRRAAVLAFLAAFALIVTAQPERVRALLDSGGKHLSAGRFDQAARDFEAARAEAERLDDKPLTAQAMVAVGDLHYLRGHMNDALVSFRRAYDLGVESKNATIVEDALNSIANVYADANVAQFDQAIRYYEQLLALSRERGDREAIADALFNIASTLDRKGDFARALSMFHEALDVEQKLGRSSEAAFVKRSIGITLSKMDRPSEAIPLFSEALTVLERAGDTDRATMVRMSRGIAFIRMEKYDAAIADLEYVADYYRRQDNPRFLEKTMEELAKAYAGDSRWPEAFRAKSAQLALSRTLAEKLREESTARLRVQFDTERKEQENTLLTRQNEASRRIRLLQTILLAAAVVVVLVVAGLALRLRSANASLRIAQEKIARFNESSGEALRDVRAWSRATAKELAGAMEAEDIVVYIQTGADLMPLTATGVKPPTNEILDRARKQPTETNEREFAISVTGMSGRIFGALVVTGKASPWTEPQRQLLSTFAHQLGGALELQQLRSDLADARDRNLATRRQMIDRGVRMLAICRECRSCFPDGQSECPHDGSRLDTSSTLPFQVAGRYEIRRLLGAGGMGEVFAARDLRLDRDVALKVIKSGRTDPDGRLRFEREARAAARVHHENVIAIFDSGEMEDGSAYLVTELLEGADLSQVIRMHGPGAISQVRQLVREGMDALIAVHDAGLVHRDVKPSNLFVIETAGGLQVKLVDFGIAKLLDAQSQLTHSGAIIGTPAYMAPEQITMGTCDARSDLFSFATVVYEALTGVRASAERPLAMADEAPLKPASRLRRAVNGEVDGLLFEAMARQPAHRPSPRAWQQRLIHALGRIADDELAWPSRLRVEVAPRTVPSGPVDPDAATSTIASPPPL